MIWEASVRLASLIPVSKIEYEDGDTILPCNHLSGTSSHSKEAKEWEDHGHTETPNRNTTLGAFTQELWSVAVE